MIKRMILPIIFGITGIAILLSLGFWQLDRLAWKLNKIAQIDARMQAAPAVIPQDANKAAHNFLRVGVEGTVTGDQMHVLTSRRSTGPGYRLVGRMETKTDSILVDFGFLPIALKENPPLSGLMRVDGNLLWPNEFDPKFTPQPDVKKNIWFAREMDAMSVYLGTSPRMVVAQKVEVFQDGQWLPLADITPWAVSSDIQNDHLAYAITWFSLAIVWFWMTVYLLYRIRQKTV